MSDQMNNLPTNPGINPDEILACEESLDELFSIDPDELTDQDLEKICQTYRLRRSAWLKQEESKSKGKNKKVGRSAEEKPQFTLESLGLSLGQKKGAE